MVAPRPVEGWLSEKRTYRQFTCGVRKGVHAARWYSCRRPPSRSRRRHLTSFMLTDDGQVGGSAGASSHSARWGRRRSSCWTETRRTCPGWPRPTSSSQSRHSAQTVPTHRLRTRSRSAPAPASPAPGHPPSRTRRCSCDTNVAPVAEHEAHLPSPLPRHQQVAGLLGDSSTVRVGGHASQIRPVACPAR
jgi:hypothetical protein